MVHKLRHRGAPLDSSHAVNLNCVSLWIVSFSYGISDGFLLDELVAFLQKVALEAPEVPFYYYHIPPLTGVKSKYRIQIFGYLLWRGGYMVFLKAWTYI